MCIDAQLKGELDRAVATRIAALTRLYRHFHAHPELSGAEVQTATRVAHEMRALGLEVLTGIGGHGVVSVLENGPGPCILLRGDMDALPVTERTGLPYASTVRATDAQGREVGVMHACGHDLHTTCLIGAAQVLTRLRERFRGRVIFVAQPAEEAIGGARPMMADDFYGRTGRPDYGLALHVKAELPVGSVGLAPGIRTSASHALDITIQGRGGHGAAPHQAVDPVVLSAQFILALQTIISREKDPAEMGLITVGAIHGGTKRNVIPNAVELNLTIRAYKEEIRLQIAAAVRRVAEGLARTAGLPPELWPVIQEAEHPYPPVINDPGLTARIRPVFADLLGPEQVVETRSSTGSEDFGYFGRTDPPIPMVFYQLGVTPPERLAEAAAGGPPVPPVHDAGFYPDVAGSLPIGVTTLTTAVLALTDSPEPPA